MDAARWQKVQQIFERAVALPTEERHGFLDTCGDDSDLLREVESLLQADAEAGKSLGAVVRGGEDLLFGDLRSRDAGSGTTDFRFGKYAVEGRIGEGGFGVVYKGRDPDLRRTVAIKTCVRPDLELRRRFFREGQIAAGLQHSHIVTVYELGVEEGVPYLVQEFLSGRDLRSLIEEGPEPSLKEKLEILCQVARGLEHAHRAGVLHRDVKPANIRILDDGTAKILDFGIAKLLDAESQLTGTGTTLGTVGYLAPEQLRSQPLDRRADVFSFGVVAYELLTKERPFQGEDFSQISYQLLYEEPMPLVQRWLDCPKALSDLIQRCLGKDPEGRPSDFEEVLAVLEPLLASVDPEAHWPHDSATSGKTEPRRAARAAIPASDQDSTLLLPPSEPKSHRIPQGGIAGVLVLLTLGLGWFFGGREEPAPDADRRLVEAIPPSPSIEREPELPPPSAASEANLSVEDALESEEASLLEEVVPETMPIDPEPPPPSMRTSEEPPGAQEGAQEPVTAGLSSQGAAPGTHSELVAEPQGEETRATAPPSSSELIEVSPPPRGTVEAEELPDLSKKKLSTPPEANPSASEDSTRPEGPTVKRGDYFTPGSGVEPPRLIDHPQPVYPRRARRRGKSWRGIVRVLVNEEGRVVQASVALDEDGFGAAARQAALEATFEPARKDGVAGKMWWNLPFEFKLE